MFVNRFVLGRSRFLGLGCNGLTSYKIEWKNYQIVPKMPCAGSQMILEVFSSSLLARSNSLIPQPMGFRNVFGWYFSWTKAEKLIHERRIYFTV